MTKVAQLLGIEYPILQGAMANISTHKLVGPVSEAGGLRHYRMRAACPLNSSAKKYV